MRYRLNITGDTLVEVLIALTVLTLVLVSSYVAANKSLNSGRESQERSLAYNLLTQQLERLKAIAKESPEAVFIAPTSELVFCAHETAGTLAVQEFPYTGPSANKNYIFTTPPTGLRYPLPCQFNAGTGIETEYKISITRGGAGFTNSFVIEAIWFSANQSSASAAEREIAQIIYNLY